MGEDRINEAARLLAAARLEQKRFDRLPKSVRPKDEAEAYAVQDRLHAIFQSNGQQRVGRKIGCTTEVMQRYLSIDSPCAGGLFDIGVHQTPAHRRHSDFRRIGVECEIAVRLSADLSSRANGHDRATVGDAVESCMAAIELVDDRYEDYRSLDTPTLIADDFFNAGAVLGPAVQDWRSLDLAGLNGRMMVGGETIGEGRGEAILGHPFEALAWLANAENQRGRQLDAGEIVLLGSLVQTQWVEAGAKVEVTIEGLGSASVVFD
jgi:2-oxo-3-hexenedioate decarboxylase/2-keto-4-pentenoate hydratase